MNLAESVRLALRALLTNKLRAVLTMLGIIIGVGAVITLMSVGQGVQVYIETRFQAIGSNLFFVIPGSLTQELRRPAYLTLKDAQALEMSELGQHILRVAPSVQGGARLSVPGRDKTVQVFGVTPAYMEVRNWQVAQGTFITSADESAQARVIVLGDDTAKALFPDMPAPIGEIVRVNGVPFRVVGVLERKGGGGSFGSEDDVAMIPLSTALAKIFPRRTAQGEPRLGAIYVQATSGDAMELAIAEVTDILRQRHRIYPGDPDDFTIISQDDLIGTFQQITSVLTTFLGAIAGISLLVGGIGIMNIMLVSVTERTREIGLRKAVGAKRRDILWQFLIEAMLLSVFGGSLGIVLGASGAQAISLLLRDEGFAAVTTLDAVLLATLFSAAVGLFFGIYPAQRAARLNPIDALRYE